MNLCLFLFFGVPTAQAGSTGAKLDYVTPAPAQAGAHRLAEYNRLADRLHYLAKKNNSKATTKIYLELAALGFPLSYADLLIGAQVFRSMGDVGASYACLEKAAKIQGTREVIDWLVAIDSQYGRVKLQVQDGMLRAIDPEIPVILPDQKAAIALAQASLEENGQFNGFLPRGTYRLADQRFEVRSGKHTLELRLHRAE
jgi:hypothetical protein